jgi:hypothetical protein
MTNKELFDGFVSAVKIYGVAIPLGFAIVGLIWFLEGLMLGDIHLQVIL